MLEWLFAILAVVGVGLIFWRFWPRPAAHFFLAAERKQGRVRARKVAHGGFDWHLLEGGHGEPLVLLHGFNGDAYHFTRVSRRLGAHFRVLAPDLPGFGKTEFEGEADFSIEAQARRVIDLLDTIGIERFYLGGSSMGGYIACALACMAPERVQGLWLLAPGGLQSAPLSPLFEVVQSGGSNALVVRSRADFGRLMDYCFVRPPWLPAPLARELADRAARHGDRAEAIFEAIRFDSTPLEDLAPAIEAPTLIVWGQADQVLHPEGLKILSGLIPHARILLMPGVGHLPMLERPRDTAEAWISFAESAAREAARAQARV